MNVLITCDDGPQSFGLKLLREVAARTIRQPIVTLVPNQPMTGSGTAIKAMDLDQMKVEQIEPDFWTCEGTPTDAIDYAFLHTDRLLNRGSWEMVLVGVNRGANTGVDIFRSGTSMAACCASAVYGCCAHAFSQEVPNNLVRDGNNFSEKEEMALFDNTAALLADYFRQTAAFGNECWNVNFPMGRARGYRTTKVAHYSRYREPPLTLVPRARKEESDITLLSEGWITTTEMNLRVNPAGRF